MTKVLVLTFVFLCMISSVMAADLYKPYLHKPAVPEHPQIRLYGEYSTNMYSGIAAYSYIIDTPKGVNGLQPTIGIFYSSESMQQRPSILGAGWSMNYNYIYRDINSTPNNINDDKYYMYLDGNMYELFNSNGIYHTKVEYYYRIQNIANYWVITKQDGTQYRFGYNTDSRVDSSYGYTNRWALDLTTDTHANTISYAYLRDPNAEDIGSQYLSSIIYNSDALRKIYFTYENISRPDRRRIYSQGNLLEESRRLTDINVIVNGQLVKRDHFDYMTLNPAMSSISNIIHYGADNISILYNISFDYYIPTNGYTNSTIYKPPVLFSNDSHYDFGSRFVDVNNDGFLDIVQSNASTNYTWINRNNTWILDNTWTIPVMITNKTGVDQGTRFEDVNNDGFSDIIISNPQVHNVYLNNGTSWVLSSWNVPEDFINSTSYDQGINIVDINGDGRPDIIKGLAGVRKVYINTGSGWALDNSWTLPIDFLNSSNMDTGARLVDINGDGFVDILQSSNVGSPIKNVWINTGAGWIIDTSWIIPVYFTATNNSDNGIRFVDANGDGLVDILDYINGSTSNAWLNNGSGWYQNNNWSSPEPFTAGGYNIGRRMADLDGDGFADIVVSHQSTSLQYSWIKNHTLPYMLKSIRNEYGGLVVLNYTTSTQFNNTYNGLSQIGFNIYVINYVVKNNSIQGNLNAVANFSYNYSLGKYNYATKEFRGFGLATEFTPYRITEHYFYQDDARKGKEYSTKTYNTNYSIYSQHDTGYNYTLENGIYNLSILYSTDYLYDGNTIPVVNNKSFFYNRFGNYEYIIDWGDVAVSGDERYYNYSYAINTNNWIVNKVARETVYDSSMNKVKESKSYYDNQGFTGLGSIGDLTKAEIWNSNGNNSFTYYEYDRYGNIISRTDNYANTEKYTYDITNTYPSTYINALGHITYFYYNFSTGNLMSTSKNGIATNYEYDIFGRITKEVQPYDSTDLPTKKYLYEFDGIAPEKITVKQRTTADKTIDTTYFYDGFTNLIQLKSKFDSNTEIVKNIFYDSEFKPFKEQNPYFANYTAGLSNVSLAENYTSYSYDALGRIIFVLNPDGTNKTVTFSQRNISDFDENGHKHKYVLDGLGRIVQVYEYNTNPLFNVSEIYITNYVYDGNDNLVKITDNEGHEFRFTYDSLSRKIGMSDPDMGNWTYSYDLNGNLVSQTDSRGQTIILYYDSLNRITNKNSTDVNISFIYDLDYYGTLSKIINNVNISYSYDKRMRKTNEIIGVDGKTYSTSYTYDSADRLVNINDFLGINYYYDYTNNIYNITGIVAATYNPLGQILTKTYGNGISTTYSYDLQNYHIKSIISPTVQNISYTYDLVGNIKTINETMYNRFYTMSYDDLDRMIRVAIGPDNYSYLYNSLGNMMKIVKNNQSKKYVYNNLAHAPSNIIDGSSGVDIYAPHDINYQSRNRTFEFFIVNDNNITLNGVNVSLEFGDKQKFNATNLTIDNNILFFIQTNYIKGGDYTVKFNATSNGINDYEWKNIKFGIRANNISIIYSNTSYRTFEFDMGSDIVENAYNASWNCSDGISSLMFNLSSKESVMDFIEHNYSSPGPKNFTCVALGVDGNESKTVLFTIDGLKIENYDVLYTNVSRRIFTYNVRDYFGPLNTNILMVGDNVSSTIVNLNASDNLMVFAEFNYSNDSGKNMQIQVYSNQSVDYYRDSFSMRGATIKNYNRVSKNYTTNILMFDVWNNWNAGYVNWSIGEPNMQNSTFLNNNESVMVFVENNYVTQGNRVPEINATISTYIDRVKEFFEIRPIKVAGILTLSESKNNSVSEFIVRNNLNSSQVASWMFDSGSANVSNDTPLNASETVFVYITSNYTVSGVYKTLGRVSVTGTGFSDNDSGIILT